MSGNDDLFDDFEDTLDTALGRSSDARRQTRQREEAKQKFQNDFDLLSDVSIRMPLQQLAERLNKRNDGFEATVEDHVTNVGTGIRLDVQHRQFTGPDFHVFMAFVGRPEQQDVEVFVRTNRVPTQTKYVPLAEITPEFVAKYAKDELVPALKFLGRP